MSVNVDGRSTDFKAQEALQTEEKQFGENPYYVRKNPLIKEVETSTHNMQDPFVPINLGTTSGTAKKWMQYVGTKNGKDEVPQTWNKMSESQKNNVVRVLITWPELCREGGISGLKNPYTLGSIRTALLFHRSTQLNLYVQNYERDFALWWKHLSGASKLLMIRMAANTTMIGLMKLF